MSSGAVPLVDIRLFCFEKIDDRILHPASFAIIQVAQIVSEFFNKPLPEQDKDAHQSNLALRVPRRRPIRKITPIKRNNPAKRLSKSHKPRKYESYSNLSKIRFLKKAAGGVVTNKPIDLKKAKKAAYDLNISWSTAKSWIKKHDEYRSTYGKTGMTYVDFLETQGERLKLGVGRKITYGKEKEEQILSTAIIARENEERPFTVRDLKQIAREIIGADFKASDGWAKKFCFRNTFIVGDKFNTPKIWPKDLAKKTSSFLNSYRILSESYTKDKIVFMDKLDLHYSLLKPTHKKKKEKPVTILFSLTSAGDILKPLAIFSGSYHAIHQYTNIVCLHTETGRITPKEVQSWTEECLGGQKRKRKNSRVLIAPTYGFLQGPDIGKIMRVNRLQFLMLPKGLNCVLNPLKEIFQIFLKDLAKSAQEAGSGKNWQDALIEWIVIGVNTIVQDHSEILKNSFNCFLKMGI